MLNSLLVVGFFFIVSCTSKVEINTSSVGAFSYNNQRNSLQLYNFKKINLIKPQPILLKSIKSDERAPLYINGREILPKGMVPESDLIAYTNGNHIYLADLQRDQQIFESTTLPGDFIFASPYFDVVTKTFYVISIKMVDLKKSPESFFSYKYVHYLSLVDLKGKIISSYQIPIQDIYYQSRGATLKDYPVESQVTCKTSPLVFHHKNAVKVVLGCAIKVDYNAAEGYYAIQRGISGAVISMDVVDAKAEFKNVFFTSSPIESIDESGFDGGIYNSGSGPSENNGSIFASIGNASVGRENYGCSVVKLKSDDLSLQGHYSFYPGPSGECHSLNLDTSSAAVSVYNFKGQEYFSATNKGGRVCFFSQDITHPMNCVELASLPFYSNGVFFEKEAELFYFSHFKSEAIYFKDVVIGGDLQASALKALGYEKEKCIGHVGPGPKADLNYYYSGEFRDSITPSSFDLTVKRMPKVIQSVTLYERIIKDYWPNYENKKIPSLALNKKASMTPALYINNHELYDVHLLFPEAHSDYIKEGNLVKITDATAGIMKGCEKGTGIKLIYSFIRSYKKPGGWGAKLFKLENSKFVLNKTFLYPRDFDPSKSQPVVIRNGSEVYGIFAAQSFAEKNTQVIIQNLFNEKEKEIVEFKGNFHFTAPLVVGNFFFFSTMNTGMHIYRWMK